MNRKAKLSHRSPQWYGWQPDLPDHRDYLYASVAPRHLKLPSKVDLRPACSPVENQGPLGSCTANALVGALEFLENKDKVEFVNLSRLFVYYNERAIEGDVRQDGGALLRDGIKSLAKLGVCSEQRWPYRVSHATYRKKPTRACYTAAMKHRIKSYHRLNTVDEMRICLADGYPFVFGFTAYEAFESETVARTGALHLPKRSEEVVGGHAVMAVGYVDSEKHFLVRNSWDTDWGMKGYFTMPYAYLSDRNLSDDFWTIRVSAEG